MASLCCKVGAKGAGQALPACRYLFQGACATAAFRRTPCLEVSHVQRTLSQRCLETARRWQGPAHRYPRTRRNRNREGGPRRGRSPVHRRLYEPAPAGARNGSHLHVPLRPPRGGERGSHPPSGGRRPGLHPCRWHGGLAQGGVAGHRLSIERQVRIGAGALVAAGSLLSLVWPAFIILPLFIGCGLVFAGVTGFCGLGLALKAMPWNK